MFSSSRLQKISGSVPSLNELFVRLKGQFLLVDCYFLRSSSFRGKLLKDNLDSEVVDALKDLRNKLSKSEQNSSR